MLIILAVASEPVAGQENNGQARGGVDPREPADSAPGGRPGATDPGAGLDDRIEEIEVIGRPSLITPLPGTVLSKDDIATNVQTLSADQIKASGALNATQILNEQLKSVTVADSTGNPFQQDVNFRGFSASPLATTPQGVSVYFDGIRVNEPFGQVVNWDLIPLNAIDGLALVPGATPLFGLNTIAGALSITTKSGFSHPGIDATLGGGSWGRFQQQATLGMNDDNLAAFLAFNRVREDGWRVNSPSDIRQLFGRGDYNGRWFGVTFAASIGDNRLTGNGTVPFADYEDDPRQIVAAPDTTDTSLRQFSVTARTYPTDATTVSFMGYRRDVDQDSFDADFWDDWERGAIGDRFGNCAFYNDGIPAPSNGAFDGSPGVPGCVPNGLANMGMTTQDSFGALIQLSWATERNQLVLGYSYDRSKVVFEQSQLLGFLDDDRTLIIDPTRPTDNVQERLVQALIDGGLIGSPEGFIDFCVASGTSLSECQALERRDEIQNVNFATGNPILRNRVNGTTATTGFFFFDAFQVSPSLTLSAGVRHNRTSVQNFVESDRPTPLWTFDPRLFENQPLKCRTDAQDVSSRFVCTEEDIDFTSWNPALGLSYSATENTTVSANFSRGSRAPSTVELACAKPPLREVLDGAIVGCTAPGALIGDPPLKQVRSKSYEIGADMALAGVDVNLALFQTDLEDDITFLSIGRGNRGFFDNFGQTRRRGLEIGLSSQTARYQWFINYSYLKATFESPSTAVNGSNSTAPRVRNAQKSFPIEPGDQIPGFPNHALRAGIKFDFTPDVSAGLTLIAQGEAFAQGNENNDHEPVGNDGFSSTFSIDAEGNIIGTDTITIDGEPFFGGRPFVGQGTIAPFWIVNFDASYRPTRNVSLNLSIENIFDKRYVTTGNLGLSPFQRNSVNFPGAVDGGGFNHNALNWQHDLFVGPGAPRAAWVSVNVTFDELF